MTDPRTPEAAPQSPSGWLNGGASRPLAPPVNAPGGQTVQVPPYFGQQAPRPLPEQFGTPPYQQAPYQAAPQQPIYQQPFAAEASPSPLIQAEARPNPAVQAEAQQMMYGTHAGHPVVPQQPAPLPQQAAPPAPSVVSNGWLAGGGPAPFAAQLEPETEGGGDAFGDMFEGNQFTELPDQTVTPAFESTVPELGGDDDPFAFIPNRPDAESEPRSIGPAWMRKLPFAGIALGAAGLGIAFIPAVHGLGFWVAFLGAIAAATGFLPPRNLRLTAIALLVTVGAAFATGLVHTGGKATPAAPAGGPNSVTFNVEGLDDSTDAALQYTVDRADLAAALRVNGANLPWTKPVAINAKTGSAQDIYTVRATPSPKAKTGLACYITVGDTIVAIGLAKPGDELVCRYTGTVDHPTAVGTMKDAKNLLDSLKAQPAAG